MQVDRVTQRNKYLIQAKLDNTLAYACSVNNKQLIKEKLAKISKKQLNQKASHYGSALHIACNDNNLDVVKLLVDADADLELKDVVSYTPLLVALAQGHETLAHYLIDAGANIHAIGAQRVSALHVACLKCSGEMVTYLINKGLDINGLASDKRSALLFTINLDEGNRDAAGALIKNGISKEHYAPAIVDACWRGNPEIVALLLEQGADVLSINGKTGKKPETLFWVCSKGDCPEEVRNRYLQVINMLIDLEFSFVSKYKFKGLIKTYEGSPLDIAKQSGFHDAVELITQRQGV